MSEELAGWKQIATYLGVSIPTARKYAKSDRLPVVNRSGRYFAFREDLDNWRRTSPQDPPTPREKHEARHLGIRLSVVLLATAILVLSMWAIFRRPSAVVRAAIEGQEVVAFRAGGRELWRVRIPDLTTPQPLPPLVEDVDGDGRNDVVLSVDHEFPERENGRLVCLTDAGELRWEVAYGRALTIDGRPFEPYYQGHHLRWLETWTGPMILVVARHAVWFPAQVLLLEPATGKVVSEYWHPGYLNAVELADLDQDGREELLLGGINNPGPGPGHPSLAVLDVPFGPPKPEGKNYFGAWNARERAYLLFPRPDLFDTQGDLATLREILVQNPNRLLVPMGGSEGNEVVHFYLDARLQVVDVRPSDVAIAEHDRLWREGVLDHPYRPEERLAWRRVLSFPTAPDGNAPEIRRSLSLATRQQDSALQEMVNN